MSGTPVLEMLDRGFDVICDKPMTNTLEQAEAFHAKGIEAGLVMGI